MSMDETVKLKLIKNTYNSLNHKCLQYDDKLAIHQEILPKVATLPTKKSIKFDFMPDTWASSRI